MYTARQPFLKCYFIITKFPKALTSITLEIFNNKVALKIDEQYISYSYILRKITYLNIIKHF